MTNGPNVVPRLLIHTSGPANEKQVTAVFRSAQNAVDAMSDAVIEVVVQGPAVALLARDSPLANIVCKAVDRRIVVVGCGNSMKSVAVEPDSLLPGVVSVPAAVAHLARRQWNGWAYVRL